MTSNPDSSTQVRRILLECTDTYFSDWNTGIQRVVRNVAQSGRAVGAEYAIECKPIVRIGHRYLALPWRPHIGRSKSKLLEYLGQLWPDRGFWDQNAVLRCTHWLGVRLRKLLYPRTLVRKINYWRWSLRGETIEPGAGDTLVLLDAWWNRNIWPAVALARQNGATVGVVMYDLLPVTNPEFFKSNVKEPFAASLKIALEQGDYFIAISQTVRDTLRDYAFEHGPRHLQSNATFASFRLGSTLDMARAKGRVRPAVVEAFAGDRYPAPFLTVGTIEPRKNHVLLLDAFDQVWQRFPEAGLCIVGRIGWLCDDLIRRIHRHPQYNRSLFMFNDLSDSELEHCYRHAKALIFPSHAEGFGLPVVEALQHGLHALVSDIPIHREVGRDFCTYFHHQRPDHLAELVCHIEQTGSFPDVRQPDEFAIPDWSESTREFVAQCLAACEGRVQPRIGQRRAA